MRHACPVQVRPDREVLGRAHAVEDREHLVLLDEPAGGLERAAGVVAVVQVRVLDRSPPDAAARVHVLEVRLGADRGAGPDDASPVSGVVPPIRISLALMPGAAAGRLPNAPGSATRATTAATPAGASHLLIRDPCSVSESLELGSLRRTRGSRRRGSPRPAAGRHGRPARCQVLEHVEHLLEVAGALLRRRRSCPETPTSIDLSPPSPAIRTVATRVSSAR